MLLKTIVFFVIAVFVVVAYLGWGGGTRFDRKRWEAVVAEIRLSGLKPGQRRTFMLDMRSEPYQLRETPPDQRYERGTGGGRVWVETSKDGKLKVVIETRDLGHGGEYGYAYSDTPLIPKPGGEGWSTVGVPGHLNLVTPNMKIDEHWWEVVYNLD